jgi:hypothetical protein
MSLCYKVWLVDDAYSEKHIKSINTQCGQNEKLLIVKAGDKTGV